MFCLADMLWADEGFIGNTYPQEVCSKILHSIEKLSSVRDDRIIEGMSAAHQTIPGEIPAEQRVWRTSLHK